jgi:rubredoxin
MSLTAMLAIDFAGVIWFLGAVFIFFFVWRVGVGLLRSMTTPLPEPPPEGELRKVNVRYRCSLCGVELRMTMAPEEDPVPPRHCMEDMDFVAPVDL